MTTRYAWDPTGLGVVLSDGAEYLWGAGLISQSTASGTPTYTHADGLGSIRLLTDATGAVVGSQQYDAFGASRAQTGVQLPFGYTGEQTDPESSLVYLRARYLDPGTGRFLTRDTFAGSLARPASLHAYTYVADSPIAQVDPSGHDMLTGGGPDDYGGGGGGGGGVVVDTDALIALLVTGGEAGEEVLAAIGRRTVIIPAEVVRQFLAKPDRQEILDDFIRNNSVVAGVEADAADVAATITQAKGAADAAIAAVARRLGVEVITFDEKLSKALYRLGQPFVWLIQPVARRWREGVPWPLPWPKFDRPTPVGAWSC